MSAEQEKHMFKMKLITKGVALSSVGMLAIACGGASDSGSDSGAEVTIRVADSFPETHVIGKNTIQTFMDDVEQASDGRIDFEYFPAEQLGKAADMLDMTQSGVADIAYIAPAYYSEDMPLGTVSGLPGVYPNSEVGSPAWYDLITGKLYDEEIEGAKVKPLVSFVTGEYQMGTTDKPIDSVDDVAGLRVRTSGGYMEQTAKELGATPVSLDGPDIYSGLERGTVNAVMISAESIPPYNLDPLLGHYTTNLALGGFGAFYAISDAKWAEIPEDLQEIMLEEGKKTSYEIGQVLADEKERLVKEFAADGMELSEVPEDATAEFNGISGGVQDAWVADMNGRGLAGTGILAEMGTLVEKHDG